MVENKEKVQVGCKEVGWVECKLVGWGASRGIDEMGLVKVDGGKWEPPLLMLHIWGRCKMWVVRCFLEWGFR